MTSDFLAGRNDFARVDVLFGPGHFADVDQTFDTWLQFHECTIVGDVRDTAGELGTQRELVANRIPRIGLQLLHAQADTLGFLVDLDDLHLDGFAD